MSIAISTTTGILRKMHVELSSPVDYYLPVGNDKVYLNELLGEVIQFKFTGNIYCIQCDRKTQKSFQQGYCFPCLKRLHECNLCVIHPERCRVEEGLCSKEDWAHQQCDQPHVVYLANSAGLKVGITREKYVPSRWIDQGAKQGLVIHHVTNRYRAGVVEVAYKKYISDRTNWRNLLKQEAETLDLVAEAEYLTSVVKLDAAINAVQPRTEVVKIDYPILQYPKKINPLSLDITPSVSGTLLGIKGQYLILDSGVINIRKFSGYEVEF